MPDSLDAYRATMQRRGERVRRERARRRREARETAARVAEFLRGEYGVDRIVLFGSLVRDDVFGTHSDVDLAVWGLDAEDYFEAVARVQGEGAPFSVDLIRIEQAPDSLRRVVEEEGRELPISEDIH
jgi:predicted nucleotidyltransferase